MEIQHIDHTSRLGQITTPSSRSSSEWMFASCIELPPRPSKPREQGLTFVLDKGMSILSLQDFIADTASFIDLVKFGWGTSRLFDVRRLRDKIQVLRDHDIRVCPGGTLLELAVLHNCVPAFLQEVTVLGFNCIEVSDGTIPMSHDTKLSLIGTAKHLGLSVVSEVGKKSPAEDRNLKLETRLSQALAELDAGAWKVIIEGRESGNVGVYADNGAVQEDQVEVLVKRVGLENLIFEAPQKSQQIWFCRQYGNQVNLANIAPADVIPVETLRYGLRADTLKDYHSQT